MSRSLLAGIDSRGAEAALAIVGTVLCAAFFLLVESPVLHAPHYWDALGCYIPQARFLAEHGADLGAYRQLPYLRPPLFIGAVALLLRRFGSDPLAAHLLTCLWSSFLPPLTYLLARQLPLGRRLALLAALCCALNPVVLAQAGIVQSDLPMTVLTTLALLLLLRGRVLAFCLCGALSVLTKESAYFLSGPAALWLLLRAQQTAVGAPRTGQAGVPGAATSLLPLQPAALGRALPGLTPGLVLALWLVVQRLLVGRAMAPVQTSSLGSPGQLGSALLHGLVESGRLPLVLLAGVAAAAALRPGVVAAASAPSLLARQRATLALASGVLLLPFCFPGSPVRYMLPSLPLLCVLGAAGLETLWTRGQRRLGLLAAAAVALALCTASFGESWHGNYGHHLEGNLAYRQLLQVHQQAAQVIAQSGARAVLADFPMRNAISETGGYGYLKEPLPSTPPTGAETLAELCRHDLLVLAEGGGDGLESARRRLSQLGALSVRARVPATIGSAAWLPAFARTDQSVILYQIRCPQLP